MHEVRINNTKLILKIGDITEEEVDAIVNAANPTLLGGGGVDGAIHAKGGPKILEECKKIGGCKPGEAVITTGGNLKAKYVIHTVGPIWHGGSNGEEEILKRAYINSLKIAKHNKVKTISFPSISTGAYGYPVELASKVALSSIIDFIKGDDFFEEVRMVLFKEKDYHVYLRALESLSK
ncbi:MAG: O-acetyl-ADP-ribose deacetylase [Proteobacteria bacterium]|nr:O-acetyl-ADP-ribose deacetylase [Pseudomonadota bacterium]